MSGRIDARLGELGIALPQAAAPAANYVPFVTTGNLLFVAGQLPMADGKVAVAGVLGAGLTLEEGQQAAKLCAINIIAQAKSALGELDRVARVVRLGAFVASSTDFTDQPRVVNGASDLMVEVFGDPGRGGRSAVGMGSLPGQIAVEVEMILEVAD